MERLTSKDGRCDYASTDDCLSQKDCYSCPHGKKAFKKLFKYEQLFIKWGLDKLNFESLEKWHERMVWNVAECDRQFDENKKLKQENAELREILKLAINDIKHDCDSCKNWQEHKSCIFSAYEPQKIKLNSSCFVWQHVDKLKELGIEV